MQFHFPRLGRWKQKRDNIPICLITKQLLEGCLLQPFPQEEIYMHTLSSTFHILLAQTQNISTCKIRISFQDRNHKRTPQSHKQPQLLRWCILVVEETQVMAHDDPPDRWRPLDDPVGLLFPTNTLFMPCSGNWVGVEGFPPTFPRLKTFRFI